MHTLENVNKMGTTILGRNIAVEFRAWLAIGNHRIRPVKVSRKNGATTIRKERRKVWTEEEAGTLELLQVTNSNSRFCEKVGGTRAYR